MLIILTTSAQLDARFGFRTNMFCHFVEIRETNAVLLQRSDHIDVHALQLFGHGVVPVRVVLSVALHHIHEVLQSGRQFHHFIQRRLRDPLSSEFLQLFHLIWRQMRYKTVKTLRNFELFLQTWRLWQYLKFEFKKSIIFCLFKLILSYINNFLYIS